MLQAILYSRFRISFSLLAIVILFQQCTSISQTSAHTIRSVNFRTIGRIPVIEARLNGKPAVFIIDTGASVSILNTREAGFYGFEVFAYDADVISITSFDGVSQIQHAGRCTVEIGSLRVTHLRFRGRDMNDFANTLSPDGECRIAGILGSDLLSQYRMKIDFVDRKVSF